MMNTVIRKGRVAGLGLLALLVCATAAPQGAIAMAVETTESIVMCWPTRTRNAAGLLLEKYGTPDQFDRNALVWVNNGEWKRTVVRRTVSRPDPAGKTGIIWSRPWAIWSRPQGRRPQAPADDRDRRRQAN